ncbi:hypothetical protein CPB86DRAFT_742648 [Serendipita vermifera]|nr:hypothetical protein CPB86DRAFT_742648 [Serendipita vermifera]
MTMPVSLATMPVDIGHNILRALTVRKDLFNAITSCHYFYDIFREHPNSILRRVVCNELDMHEDVMQYAWDNLRLCRASEKKRHPHTGVLKIHEPSLSISTQAESIRTLADNHKVVKNMTKTFSIRYKDNGVLCSALTAEEGRRFQIAVYVYWQYCYTWRYSENDIHRCWHKRLLNEDEDDDDDFDSDDDDDDETETETESEEEGERDGDKQDKVDRLISHTKEESKENATMQKCNELLDSLPYNVLCWLKEVIIFVLQEMDYVLQPEKGTDEIAAIMSRLVDINYSVGLDANHLRHHILSQSPTDFGLWEDVLGAYGFAPTPLTAQELWLSDALYHAQKRSSTKELFNESERHIISPKMALLSTSCRKCGVTPGRFTRYHNETNLEEFANGLAPHFFPGRLGHNPVEMKRFYRRVFGPQSTTRWPYYNDVGGYAKVQNLVKDVFEHATTQANRSLMNEKVADQHELVLSDDEDEEMKDDSGAKKEEEPSSYQGREGDYRWSPLDVLCSACFNGVFSEKWYAWWLEERQSSRVEPHQVTGDCWWGLECFTQRKEAHAQKLNHCCPRTHD